MVTDTISDVLARIKNAITVKKREIIVPNNKITLAVIEVIKNEDLLNGYKVTKEGIELELKYINNVSVIEGLKKVSKPGRRIYVSYKDIKPVMNGRGISVISTSQGVMSGALAKSKKLGGELICEIW